jgi:hypothetical protein
MKKLAITLPGHPFSSQDLLHLQNAYSEIFPNITGTQVGKNAIVSGFKLQLLNSTLSWTEGYAKYNNEIFKIPAGTLAYTPTNVLYLDIVQNSEKPSDTTVTPYNVLYKGNAVPQSVHVYRNMTPKIGPGVLQLTDYILGTGYYQDVIINKVLNFQWVTANFIIFAGNASGPLPATASAICLVFIRPHPNSFLEFRVGPSGRGGGTTTTYFTWNLTNLIVRKFSDPAMTIDAGFATINSGYLIDNAFYNTFGTTICSTPAAISAYSDAGGLTSVTAFSNTVGSLLTQINTSNSSIEWCNRRDKQAVFTKDVVSIFPISQIIRVLFTNFS